MCNKWLSIETAPKDGTSVIVSSDSGVVGEAQFHEHEDGWWWAGFDPTDYVDGRLDAATHWMPLPSPPADSEGKL